MNLDIKSRYLQWTEQGIEKMQMYEREWVKSKNVNFLTLRNLKQVQGTHTSSHIMKLIFGSQNVENHGKSSDILVSKEEDSFYPPIFLHFYFFSLFPYQNHLVLSLATSDIIFNLNGLELFFVTIWSPLDNMSYTDLLFAEWIFLCQGGLWEIMIEKSIFHSLYI